FIFRGNGVASRGGIRRIEGSDSYTGNPCDGGQRPALLRTFCGSRPAGGQPRRALITIGVPSKPNFSRKRLIKNRSAEKCSLPVLSINTINVGGRTDDCVMNLILVW